MADASSAAAWSDLRGQPHVGVGCEGAARAAEALCRDGDVHPGCQRVRRMGVAEPVEHAALTPTRPAPSADLPPVSRTRCTAAGLTLAGSCQLPAHSCQRRCGPPPAPRDRPAAAERSRRRSARSAPSLTPSIQVVSSSGSSCARPLLTTSVWAAWCPSPSNSHPEGEHVGLAATQCCTAGWRRSPPALPVHSAWLVLQARGPGGARAVPSVPRQLAPPTPPNALTQAEREQILEVLNSSRFCHKSVGQTWATPHSSAAAYGSGAVGATKGRLAHPPRCAHYGAVRKWQVRTTRDIVPALCCQRVAHTWSPGDKPSATGRTPTRPP